MFQHLIAACLLVSLPAVSAAQSPVPAELQQTPQAGELLIGTQTCPGMLLMPQFATVTESCLRDSAPETARFTDLVFFTLDGSDLPLYRLPVLGWMLHGDQAPRGGGVRDAVGIGGGLVMLQLDVESWQLSDPDALPLAQDARTPTREVGVTRGLVSDPVVKSDCELLRDLSGQEDYAAALLCDMTERDKPAEAAAPVNNRPKVNRGIGGTAGNARDPMAFDLDSMRLGVRPAQPRNPGARFVSPGGS
ncbi:hypothetical protein [Pacificoceanicola onchidii]|uniref:hypothetical protein n=1 Tax=Pacificoceanicola onchidii TaxID=2562685 RepID=UPI0010A5E36C|nr:hypothetical protein [Pacificoceanicola onchidii]